MTREEWYKHTTMDHVQALDEYVQIMRDGAMETDMHLEDIDNLYRLLCELQYFCGNFALDLNESAELVKELSKKYEIEYPDALDIIKMGLQYGGAVND